MLRLGFVPIVRPLFRGAQMGLWEASQRALAELAVRLEVDLAYAAQPVSDAEGARARAAEAQAAEVDALLVLHVTFATGDVVAPFLELPVPVGLWALPEVSATGPLPQNALCGLMLSMSLRVGRRAPLLWLYGRPEDPSLHRRIDLMVRAARGWGALRHGRLLWVGGTAPRFYRFEGVPDLDVRIDRAPLEAVFAALERIPEGAVSARLAELAEPSAVPAEALHPTIRLSLALEEMGRGYDGIALRCWPELPEAAGTMACAPFAWLGDRGHPLACEGDVGGLAAMLAVAAVTGGPAAMLDLSHVDGDGLMFWHCGNAPRAWAASQTRLEMHFNRGLPAVRHMRLRPGPVSGLRFLEEKRAAVFAGTIRARPGGFDGVSGWVGDLRWGGEPTSPHGFLASALNHRLPHHFVWGMGEAEEALLELSDWLGYQVLPLAPEARGAQWPS